jgi:hypothetical protein
MTIGYSRYGIAWKWKDGENWRLWVTEEYPAVPIGFQHYSDCDHRLPNAKDFMNQFVERPEVDCKIVEVEYQVYDLEFIESEGIVRRGKI